MFDYLTTDGGVKIGKVIRHVITGFIVLVVLFGGFGQIEAGEMGIKTLGGAVKGVIEPGFYFKIPLVEKVVVMDVRTQSLIATKDEPLSAASNDLQDTKLAVVVNYHIDKTTVANIYQQYGSADVYYNTVVDPLIIATVKAIASQYTAADQIQKRQEMSANALSALQSAFEGRNVAIEKADITDVSFSESFTQAIEAKVTAVQQAEAAKNKLAQVEYEKQQRIAQAEGEAEAIRIQAQAVTQQGGKDYVELERIKKWNGAGCTSYCGLETANGILINR